jgi:hypothetical protein
MVIVETVIEATVMAMVAMVVMVATIPRHHRIPRIQWPVPLRIQWLLVRALRTGMRSTRSTLRIMRRILTKIHMLNMADSRPTWHITSSIMGLPPRAFPVLQEP